MRRSLQGTTLNVSHYCASGSSLNQGLCQSDYAIAASDTGAIIMALYKYSFYYRLSAQ